MWALIAEKLIEKIKACTEHENEEQVENSTKRLWIDRGLPDVMRKVQSSSLCQELRSDHPMSFKNLFRLEKDERLKTICFIFPIMQLF